MKKDFSKITLNSKLFKGRSGWYFCYLKTEKIASACSLLTKRAAPDAEEALRDIAHAAERVMEEVVYTAAGEVSEEALLASLFSLLSNLRLRSAEGQISKETAKVLIDEYEGVIERIAGENRHLGLSLSSHDLVVPVMAEESLFSPIPSFVPQISLKDIRDTHKGHSVVPDKKDNSLGEKGQDRAALILDFVMKNKGVSIREIAMVVRGYSEKTIQRDLNTMIEQGIVTRQGERRWSTYHPIG